MSNRSGAGRQACKHSTSAPGAGLRSPGHGRGSAGPGDDRPCTRRRGTGRHRRTPWIGLLLATTLAALACGNRPYGPSFEPAPYPPENRSRLYVYRVDDRTSLATVRVTVDGIELGRFRDREYETVELPSGTHTVRATMRGFGLVSWGWNDQQARTRPGETVYLKLEVRLADVAATESPATRGREMEIAGRSDGAPASENVFIVPRTSAEAVPELRLTTRLPGEDDEGE
jgi:hypothetical protein